ncbi:MAG TPA: TIGR03668 family PPOX class F420-dependent oxidoreductase [Acidimicrobiales bacterium]|nr:TIGR03668 family PPOX class F420-dependent oxidoreductase [Acidimicrobiales bacterium]HWI03953.1 TIGR03668 family PPOX class F420-dependent oxidoreductase [Acidimicrobiales bacterium]
MTGLDPEVRRWVAEAPVGRLATVGSGGRPHIVPVTFFLDGDEIASAVDHKPKTTTDLKRLRNIEANPAASVLVDHYEADWSRLWWVRADGNARVLTSGERRERAVAGLLEKYPLYRKTPPEGPVIVLAVTRWSSWSAGARRHAGDVQG